MRRWLWNIVDRARAIQDVWICLRNMGRTRWEVVCWLHSDDAREAIRCMALTRSIGRRVKSELMDDLHERWKKKLDLWEDVE